MDLSLNPSSWTLGNLAEAAAEKLTGSEFIGDLAGGLVSYATFDFAGVVDQGIDASQNVGGFISDVATAVDKNFGSGGTQAPNQCKPTDFGFGTDPTGKSKAASGGYTSDLANLNLDNMSIDEMIFALMMAAIKDKRNAIRGHADDLKALGKKHAGAIEGKDQAGATEVSDEKDDVLRKLQKEQNSLSQMSQLLTNMMQSMHQMNQGIIQNIR
ncbi:hypothetical protein ACFL59_00795 [Planctomycetota bacterium]